MPLPAALFLMALSFAGGMILRDLMVKRGWL